MRGWLRLWTALTIFWLIGIAAFAWRTWPQTPPDTWTPPAYAVPVVDDPAQQRVLNHQRDVRVARLQQRELVDLVAAPAILPPVGMLLLAAMVRWVYRGFTSN